ncbi:type I restriction-modification system subunit M [uncultured Marixanthomonas sp.]|uniref:type I restriction-modification system subunit M n=1 Tax=uncultured Marixanthomonas sp. TaxID=757245 RepID=UPI0030D855EE|tara:strand:- start:40225 stop:42645 length:2421 start_codon:yes stop_codon:yes gene_type:complete
MAIKKSELYSSLWKSCDELRGGMDASQYKDYILPLLFIKYVSDKYANDEDALITIPESASFDDLVKMKGKDGIGDYINKKVLAPIDRENGFNMLSKMADFNDEDKLGKGKELIEKLSKLIAIFENPALNFSNNRAEDDDLLGDAYEYLMQHFAKESGKSKGQFYTPAEVSRIMAKIIGVDTATSQSQTVYDPACGSASLLLKVNDEAPHGLTIYGQEKDNATVALAKMNMVLHNNPEAVQDIVQGNTLADPIHKDGEQLKRFDFCVANPPFSVKSWSNGFLPESDIYKRFDGFGIPPNKNGDYAFLLHIIRSLKTKGKGAVILPHGVLFRGNAEATIRTNIVKRGLIKGIIGLPANLFFGTGIPACIIVIDKANAGTRKGLFMIDGSKGYIKDGNKNRLREQDLHKIVDVFNNQMEVAKFSRMVSYEEIEANEYNLNIPRYIDSQDEEDIQDIQAHLLGDIPNRDIEALHNYWNVYPNLKEHLFHPAKREHYSSLVVPKANIKETIFNHAEFIAYRETLNKVYNDWESETKPKLWNIEETTKPKELIFEISESLLKHYKNKALINPYDIYQHLMDYWNDILKDDSFLIKEDGWVATLTPLKDKKGKIKKGEFESELIPFDLVISRFFNKEQTEVKTIEAYLDTLSAEMTELKEEHSADEGLLNEIINEKGNITKGDISKRLKEIKGDDEYAEEYYIIHSYEKLMTLEAANKKSLKEEESKLKQQVYTKYPQLTEREIKTLIVEDKWLAVIKNSIDSEIDRISQRLTSRITELANRYEYPLPQVDQQVKELQTKVTEHLQKMGMVWK